MTTSTTAGSSSTRKSVAIGVGTAGGLSVIIGVAGLVLNRKRQERLRVERKLATDFNSVDIVRPTFALDNHRGSTSSSLDFYPDDGRGDGTTAIKRPEPAMSPLSAVTLMAENSSSGPPASASESRA